MTNETALYTSKPDNIILYMENYFQILTTW